jgi:50S ribosomal protein L16 3-hydroxylase
MQKNTPLTLLAGLSPAQFMKHHWQKKPLLIRQAIAGFAPLVDRSTLLAMVESEEVESRCIVRKGAAWTLRKGPFSRRSLPSLKTPDWTVLLQGVDLHNDAVHALLQQFRFVPDARLDDLMISYATDGGGVGPHFDSYDVFLLQAHGQRRWRIGRQKTPELQADVPLKILKNFQPEAEYLLNPGDMLYLPPGYAHDGTAVGECMTYSVGFKVPSRAELARQLLLGLADEAGQNELKSQGAMLYQDAQQEAALRDAQIPLALQNFAFDAVKRAMKEPQLLNCLLGEYLTEPKPQVWFDARPSPPTWPCAIVLDRRTKMLHDAKHIFVNGESFKATGRDAKILRLLAKDRRLSAHLACQLSPEAAALVQDWGSEGWWA